MEDIKAKIIHLTGGGEKMKQKTNNILQPHRQLSKQLSKNFDDEELQKLYKQLTSL